MDRGECEIYRVTAVITRTRKQSFSDADPSRRESQADRCLESGSLIRKRAIDRAIHLIAGRGDDAQRPDAGRSATCETEPRQHVLAGGNDEHSTGRVVQLHSWVWIAARMAVPGAGTITDRLTHGVHVMNTTWS